MQNSFRTFISRLKQVPTGFKDLYNETKVARELLQQAKSGSKILSRRESELIRSNSAAVKKISSFFLLQLPPVVGYVAIAVYFQYPRQLLTRHFWSPDQNKEFMSLNYQDRLPYRQRISQLIPHTSSPNTISLNDLSDENIRTLAGAAGVCSVDLSINLLPRSHLQSKLDKLAKEIVRDDRLLRLEGSQSVLAIPPQPAATPTGTSSSTTSSSSPAVEPGIYTPTEAAVRVLEDEEVWLACLRRGLDPADADGRSTLARWLEAPLSRKADEKDVSATVSAEHKTQVILAVCGLGNTDEKTSI